MCRALIVAVTLSLAGLVILGAPTTTRATEVRSISGAVYFDADMDWERDAGELPAEGVRIKLSDPTGISDLAIATSGDDGAYAFPGLLPERDYMVAIVMDPETPCITGGYADARAGETWTGIDLGVMEYGEGVVEGNLVEDKDGDGVADEREPGAEGWQVSVVGRPAAVPETPQEDAASCSPGVTTGRSGAFRFEHLPPGVYQLSPAGPSPDILWEATFPTDAAPVPGLDDLRSLAGGVDLTEAPFMQRIEIGVHKLFGTATIGGSVFADQDRDGVRDGGEAVLDCSVLPVFLQLFHDATAVGTLYVSVPEEDFTCSGGHWQISALAAGRYNVRFPFWCDPPYPPGPPEDPGVAPNRWVDLEEGQRMLDVDLARCPVESTPAPDAPVKPPTAIPTALPTSSPSPDLSAPDTGYRPPDDDEPWRYLFALAATGVALLVGGGLTLLAGGAVVGGSRRTE